MQGYFFIALGEQYIDECYILALTIKRQGDDRPVGLLIHQEDIKYAQSFDIFDQLVIFNPNDQLWKDCNTSFEKYCLYPRIYLNKYTPYEESITVDSDVLCQYNADKVWEFCSNNNKPIVMTGRHIDPSWHWGQINQVSEAFGKMVPHVHGGFFYLRKDPFLDTFFNYCKEVFYKYDDYNCKRMFRGGKVDEIIFAVAHAHFDMLPVDFSQFPIMTFNYHPEIDIPSKLQTEGGRVEELDDYIPFVHMFDKIGGHNYENLLTKIMQ